MKKVRTLPIVVLLFAGILIVFVGAFFMRSEEKMTRFTSPPAPDGSRYTFLHPALYSNKSGAILTMSMAAQAEFWPEASPWQKIQLWMSVHLPLIPPPHYGSQDHIMLYHRPMFPRDKEGAREEESQYRIVGTKPAIYFHTFQIRRTDRAHNKVVQIQLRVPETDKESWRSTWKTMRDSVLFLAPGELPPDP